MRCDCVAFPRTAARRDAVGGAFAAVVLRCTSSRPRRILRGVVILVKRTMDFSAVAREKTLRCGRKRAARTVATRGISVDAGFGRTEIVRTTRGPVLDNARTPWRDARTWSLRCSDRALTPGAPRRDTPHSIQGNVPSGSPRSALLICTANLLASHAGPGAPLYSCIQ